MFGLGYTGTCTSGVGSGLTGGWPGKCAGVVVKMALFITVIVVLLPW